MPALCEYINCLITQIFINVCWWRTDFFRRLAKFWLRERLYYINPARDLLSGPCRNGWTLASVLYQKVQKLAKFVLNSDRIISFAHLHAVSIPASLCMVQLDDFFWWTFRLHGDEPYTTSSAWHFPSTYIKHDRAALLFMEISFGSFKTQNILWSISATSWLRSLEWAGNRRRLILHRVQLRLYTTKHFVFFSCFLSRLSSKFTLTTWIEECFPTDRLSWHPTHDPTSDQLRTHGNRDYFCFDHLNLKPRPWWENAGATAER